jgi:hypothetical protein
MKTNETPLKDTKTTTKHSLMTFKERKLLAQQDKLYGDFVLGSDGTAEFKLMETGRFLAIPSRNGYVLQPK